MGNGITPNLEVGAGVAGNLKPNVSPVTPDMLVLEGGEPNEQFVLEQHDVETVIPSLEHQEHVAYNPANETILHLMRTGVIDPRMKYEDLPQPNPSFSASGSGNNTPTSGSFQGRTAS